MPRSFRDNQGRVWLVAVVFNSIVNVLALTGIDLRHLVNDHEATAAELDNPATLKQVVGILTEEQRDKLNVSVDDLFKQIATVEQSDAVVLSVYQATFDFFQSQGGVMNDALNRVERARLAAQTHRTHLLKTDLDNGRMDKFLAIVFDPDKMAQWAAAAVGPTAVPQIAAAWTEVLAAELPEAKRFPALIRTCLERGLTLESSLQAAPSGLKPELQQPSTPLPSAGDSPGSAASIPAPSVGGNSP